MLAPLAAVLLTLLRVAAEEQDGYLFSTERLLSDLAVSAQNVRVLALREARGRQLDDRALAHICGILADEHDPCRAYALESLLTLRPIPDLAATAFADLLTTPATPVHFPLAQALLERGSAALPVLARFAQPGRALSVGVHRTPILSLIERLEQRAGPGGRAAALLCMADADDAVALQAMRALMRRDGKVGDEIRQQVVSPREALRFAALVAGAPELPPLIAASYAVFTTRPTSAILSQPDLCALQAIGIALTDPARTPDHMPRQAMNDQADDVAAAAVEIWGRRGCTWSDATGIVATLTSAAAATSCVTILPRQWDERSLEPFIGGKSGPWGRWCVARYLASIDPEDADRAAVLIARLPMDAFTVTERVEFIRALRHVVRIGVRFGTELTTCLKAMPVLDDDSVDAHFALLTEAINRGQTDLKDVLFTAVESQSRRVRTAAVRALTALDHWSQRIITALVKALEDDAASVVVIVSEGLRERSSLVTWEVIRGWVSERGISHRKAETRREAFRLIETFGAGRADARDIVLRVVTDSSINDNDLQLALRALRYMAKLTPDQAQPIRDLMRQHRQPRVRVAAAAALIPSGLFLVEVYEQLVLEVKSQHVSEKDKTVIQTLIDTIPAN